MSALGGLSALFGFSVGFLKLVVWLARLESFGGTIDLGHLDGQGWKVCEKVEA